MEKTVRAEETDLNGWEVTTTILSVQARARVGNRCGKEGGEAREARLRVHKELRHTLL